jgi:mannose-6-phosphate isomerase-like protein (cupin superfamily)
MRTILLATVLIVSAMSSAGAQRGAIANGEPAARTALAIPADAIKWIQVRPGQETSVLWGERSVGPYGSFNKFASGFDDRPHYHTRDLHSVVVTGTFVVQNANGPAQELGPGSYGFVPGGTVHTHSCKAGVPCIIFVQQDGPGDSVPAGNAR